VSVRKLYLIDLIAYLVIFLLYSYGVRCIILAVRS